MTYASSIIIAAAKDMPKVADKVISPPMLYWVFWAILILVMALLVAYIIEMRRVEISSGLQLSQIFNLRHHEGHGYNKSIYDGLTFAGIVSALALGAFAITFSNEFYKYTKYYEHPVIGVIRFIVMAITALLLMYYAINGRHDH